MTYHKNPIEQCASLNPLVLPEYGLHMMSTILFLCVVNVDEISWIVSHDTSGEFFDLINCVLTVN